MTDIPELDAIPWMRPERAEDVARTLAALGVAYARARMVDAAERTMDAGEWWSTYAIALGQAEGARR